MLCGLITITWFDLSTVLLTFTSIVLVQVINAVWFITEGDESLSKKDRKLLDGVSLRPKDVTDYTVRNTASLTSVLSESEESFIYKTLPLRGNKSLTANEKIFHKQQSEQQLLQHQKNENGLTTASSSYLSAPQLLTSNSAFSPSSSVPPTPPPLPSSAKITSNNNARQSFSGILPPNVANFPDSLSDEYHEDEDTLSVENLFPCDQSQIYATKKIAFIIDELIQTEGNYIKNLRKGLENYDENLQKAENLPDSLKTAENRLLLLGNVAEILNLHEKYILPLLVRNQFDLKSMFDEMSGFIDKNHFYCYILFTINKKTSMQLRKDNREWLQSYQNEINDRLGIDSFLVQPIQRLTRYPLLLQQFIGEFYKSGIDCKPVLVSVCKLETRMRRLLEVVNQAEEIPSIEELLPEFNLLQLGSFRRSTELDASHHKSRKKFRAKVFLFEQCLLCAEIRKKRLAYRNHYEWPQIDLQLKNSKCVSLLVKNNTTSTLCRNGSSSSSSDQPDSPTRKMSKSDSCKSSKKDSSKSSSSSSSSDLNPAYSEEYEFCSPEAISITAWLRCARQIIEDQRTARSQMGKITIPMDMVLGVIFAILLVWYYFFL